MYRYQRAKEKKLIVKFREKRKMQTLGLKSKLTTAAILSLTVATTSLQQITSSSILSKKNGLKELYNASLYSVEMHIKSKCIEQLNAKERTTKRYPITVRIQASLHLISQAHVKPH